VRPVHALLEDAAEAFAARPFLDFLGARHSYAEAAGVIAKAALGFQRSPPCQCGISADAWAGPNWSAGIDNELLMDEALAFDHRFDSAFDVELRHTSGRTFTPAEALMSVLQGAKAAREAYRGNDKAIVGRKRRSR
jgi:hypothetical protein